MPVPYATNTPPVDSVTRGLALEEITRSLTDGHLLPGQPSVEVRETHASRVFITPTDVYKLKKPVNLGFLDYSTLRRRSRMCRQEVALNRRLAPDVYLGVERVTRERSGTLKLNGRGRVVDYLVHMRRLPDQRSLDYLLRTGAATAEDVRRVGALLGAFHQGAAPAALSFGPQTFRHNARENLLQLRESWPATLPPTALREMEVQFGDVLKQNWSILGGRAREGRVRDGHGDLRMEHIYLEDQIQIIDCVEFSKRYRASDTALDFAFLVMDLAANGYPDMVEPLVVGYQSNAGDAVAAVLPLYGCYRAFVRAKVASILESEGNADDGTRAAARLGVRRNLHYAVRVLRNDERPLLIAVSGLPGTGKTTIARALGAATGATVHSADETRKRLAGVGSRAHLTQPIDSGLYSNAMNVRVYHALIEGARAALRRGRSCVLDATFRRQEDRDAARDLATRLGAQFILIRCEAPEEIVIERLRQRSITPDPWSDATVETYHAHRRQYQAAPQASDYLSLPTTLPLIEQVDIVLSRVWS